MFYVCSLIPFIQLVVRFPRTLSLQDLTRYAYHLLKHWSGMFPAFDKAASASSCKNPAPHHVVYDNYVAIEIIIFLTLRWHTSHVCILYSCVITVQQIGRKAKRQSELREALVYLDSSSWQHVHSPCLRVLWREWRPLQGNFSCRFLFLRENNRIYSFRDVPKVEFFVRGD